MLFLSCYGGLDLYFLRWLPYSFRREKEEKKIVCQSLVITGWHKLKTESPNGGENEDTIWLFSGSASLIHTHI